MAKTPLEIIQHYIDQFEILKQSPEARKDAGRVVVLDMKIHLLTVVKLDIEMEQEAHEQSLQGK